MALINDQKSQFLTDMRALAELLDLVRKKAKELDQKWNSLAFGSGGANEFVDGDMTGTTYDGLGVTALTACVTSVQGFETWYNAGHDDNMQKIMN